MINIIHLTVKKIYLVRYVLCTFTFKKKEVNLSEYRIIIQIEKKVEENSLNSFLYIVQITPKYWVPGIVL